MRTTCCRSSRFRAAVVEIYPSSTFRANPVPGMVLKNIQSNVQVARSPSGQSFVATVPASVQDVETVELPRIPPAATGISLRMYSSGARRVWLQLYAPDANNYYEANVDFSGKVQDVALSFSAFGRVGNPRRNAIQLLRFASLNNQLRDQQMYVGAVQWLFRESRSSNVPYLALATNRWDQYYFGSDRPHVLFEALAGLAPVYADIGVSHTGNYDIFAHVQEYKRPISLQVSVAGKWSACSSNRPVTDVSERVIRLMHARLTAGSHTIGLRYCNVPPRPRWQDVGVQSLIVAASKLAAPAQRAQGDVDVVDQQPGTILLHTTAKSLVFSDAFDDRWEARQNGATLDHVMVNGYANGWLVPDPGAGDVLLSFAPQRPFTMGMRITFMLTFLALGAIVMIVISSGARSSPRCPR